MSQLKRRLTAVIEVEIARFGAYESAVDETVDMRDSRLNVTDTSDDDDKGNGDNVAAKDAARDDAGEERGTEALVVLKVGAAGGAKRGVVGVVDCDKDSSLTGLGCWPNERRDSAVVGEGTLDDDVTMAILRGSPVIMASSLRGAKNLNGSPPNPELLPVPPSAWMARDSGTDRLDLIKGS